MSKETITLALDELKHIKQWCLRSIGIGLVNENVLAALEEALAKQEQGEHLAMQVRPLEFAELIKGKETVTGIPAYWAEWPNKEEP